ncbi:outer membrane protein [Bradyrhizobium sp. Cp5.3]|uniref:outer membrane protein n=1 Tax=Bradyrhizobium sp. Cp5.3 TaxID=443598 RepID=UPI000A042529|nr:outer membrane beta-barrel protein [Bradyrhizobium sp. Cp5.3]
MTITGRLAWAVTLGLALTQVASAADFPVKATAYEAVYNWTGFYAGVNVGGGWGRSSVDASFDPRSRFDTAVANSTSGRISGGLGGLQAGYNMQINRLIFGVETDIQATGQQGKGQSTASLTSPNECLAPCVQPPPTVTNAPLNHSQSLPWFGTLRGRIGFMPSDRSLFYVTGGLAYGEIDASTTLTVAPQVCLAPCTPNPGGSITSNFGQAKLGWVVGAGFESALVGGWTGKIEYLHLDFGSISSGLTQVAIWPFVGTLQASSRLTDDIVRVGVNYRFGNAAVAKY